MSEQQGLLIIQYIETGIRNNFHLSSKSVSEGSSVTGGQKSSAEFHQTEWKRGRERLGGVGRLVVVPSEHSLRGSEGASSA